MFLRGGGSSLLSFCWAAAPLPERPDGQVGPGGAPAGPQGTADRRAPDGAVGARLAPSGGPGGVGSAGGGGQGRGRLRPWGVPAAAAATRGA
eukprot:1177398-Prorocentrum_minimum.AAC.5